MSTSMPKWFQKIFGVTPWKQEWQKELTDVLRDAQRGLSANMVVIVARESDIYAEVLFIFSFLGLTIGALIAFFIQSSLVHFEQIILYPLAGFSAGATLYTFRRFYITRLAPRAVKERVTQKAKSQFFDHYAQLTQRLALIYISEIEKEALFLASPDIEAKLPRDEIQKALNRIVSEYRIDSPLKSLGPGLQRIGESLRSSVMGLESLPQAQAQNALVIMASDQKKTPAAIPILKGIKDIN